MTGYSAPTWDFERLRAFARERRGVRYPLGYAPVDYRMDESDFELRFDLMPYRSVQVAVAGVWIVAVAMIFLTGNPGTRFSLIGMATVLVATGLFLNHVVSAPARSRTAPLLSIRDGMLRYEGASVPEDDIGGLVVVHDSDIFIRRETHLLVDKSGAPLLVLAENTPWNNRREMSGSYLTMLDRRLRCGVWKLLPCYGAERLVRVPPVFPATRP